jgi:iron complex transport system substrate-binding protein
MEHSRSHALLPVRAVLVLLLALALTGCGRGGGGAVTGAAGEGSEGPDGAAASCAGPVTAQSAPVVEPIVDDPDQTLPVTYTDVTGQPVTIADTSRVLALDSYGTLASTVYALGLGDRLVGRDVSTGIPALADLPLVTHNGHELNGEAILDLAPTLVITDYSIGPLEVQLQLVDSGIPVVILSDQRSLAEIGRQIEAVAEVLGVPDVGRRLADQTSQEITAAQARVAEMAPPEDGERLRMVFLYLRGTAGVFYWFGEGSGADDLIESLEGIDVATEAGLEGMRPLNAEGLVRADPDLFLMMTKGLESVGGVDGLLSVPGVAETTAGLDGCVVDMSDYQILSFGPQFPATLTALAEAIYGNETAA